MASKKAELEYTETTLDEETIPAMYIRPEPETGRVFTQLVSEATTVARIAEAHGVDRATALRIGIDYANGVNFRYRLVLSKVEQVIATVFQGKIKKRWYYVKWEEFARRFIKAYDEVL